MKPRVFLAMPLYGRQVDHMAAAAFYVYPSTREKMDLEHATMSCSLLGRVFSTLWAAALNQAQRGLFTHFAMLHGDISPCKWWLDILMGELEAHNGDIISTVVPIKDMNGLTSTAVADLQSPWSRRRLTMHEVYNRLPETFDAEDCHAAKLNPDRAPLLINTGCLLCDLRRPWVLGQWTQNRPCMFTIHDRLYKGPDGNFTVETESEDWAFSRAAAAAGAKILATRKVQADHYGEIGWSNANVWGEWKHDRDSCGEVPPEYADLMKPEEAEERDPGTTAKVAMNPACEPIVETMDTHQPVEPLTVAGD